VSIIMTLLSAEAKRYTLPDLEALPDDVGVTYELYDGTRMTTPPSQRNATELAAELVYLLKAATRGTDLGYVAGADAGYILARNPDTLVSPDASFSVPVREIFALLDR
jgi:Uma2 family endonuclease